MSKKEAEQKQEENLGQKIDGILRSLESITEVLARHDNAINAILADLQTKNPVASTQIQPQLIQSQQSKDEFAKNEDTKNLVANILPMIMQKFLAPENNTGFGQIFQELLIRDFLENYQSSKLLMKAQLNMLLKKGLIEDQDYKTVSENTNILNDPVNGAIKKMRNKKE